MSIVVKFKKALWQSINLKISKAMTNQALSLCRKFKVQDLSSRQKKEIKKMWGEWPTRMGYLYGDYRLFLHLKKWDINYIPVGLYNPFLLRCLNPREYNSYQDKSMMWKNFSTVPQPRTIIKTISGVLYDEDNNILYDNPTTLLQKGVDYIIKPTDDTGGGKGVCKFTFCEPIESIEKMISSYKNNYLIQECVKQSRCTAELNPDSLNTLRITTLYINGKFSVQSKTIRCGKPGGYLDNVGSGGYIIAIDDEGYLSQQGYCKDGAVNDT